MRRWVGSRSWEGRGIQLPGAGLKKNRNCLPQPPANHTTTPPSTASRRGQPLAMPRAAPIAAAATHLELDVARVLHEALQVDVAVAKGGLCLLLRLPHQRQELVLVLGQAHAPAAAARSGLDHDREPDLVGHLRGGVGGWSKADVGWAGVRGGGMGVRWARSR